MFSERLSIGPLAGPEKEEAMKNKKIPGSFLFSELWGAPAFVMLAALFVCGAIAGCFTGQMAAGSGLALVALAALAMTSRR